MNCLNSYGYDVAQHNLVSIKRRIDAKLNSCKAECDSCGDAAFKLKIICGNNEEFRDQRATSWFDENIKEQDVLYDLWSQGEFYLRILQGYDDGDSYTTAVQFIISNPFCALEIISRIYSDGETGDSMIDVDLPFAIENNSSYSDEELGYNCKSLLEDFFTYALQNDFYYDLTLGSFDHKGGGETPTKSF